MCVVRMRFMLPLAHSVCRRRDFVGLFLEFILLLAKCFEWCRVVVQISS
jgi:hypothetical protein